MKNKNYKSRTTKQLKDLIEKKLLTKPMSNE